MSFSSFSNFSSVNINKYKYIPPSPPPPLLLNGARNHYIIDSSINYTLHIFPNNGSIHNYNNTYVNTSDISFQNDGFLHYCLVGGGGSGNSFVTAPSGGGGGGVTSGIIVNIPNTNYLISTGTGGYTNNPSVGVDGSSSTIMYGGTTITAPGGRDNGVAGTTSKGLTRVLNVTESGVSTNTSVNDSGYTIQFSNMTRDLSFNLGGGAGPTPSTNSSVNKFGGGRAGSNSGRNNKGGGAGVSVTAGGTNIMPVAGSGFCLLFYRPLWLPTFSNFTLTGKYFISVIGIYSFLTFYNGSGSIRPNNGNYSFFTLIVGGGGSGGSISLGSNLKSGGGGGAGGVGMGTLTLLQNTTYNISIGEGGAIAPLGSKNNGSNTTIVGGTINEIAYGGGGGGSPSGSNTFGDGSYGTGIGSNGALGGYASSIPSSYTAAPSKGFSTGNLITYYGNTAGFIAYTRNSSGGGGAGRKGYDSSSNPYQGGSGGDGILWTYNGSYYGGGGGGGTSNEQYTLQLYGNGGIGGGGAGAVHRNIAENGIMNTGGGGGGGGCNQSVDQPTFGGAGGSGVVIFAILSSSIV